MIIGLRFGIMSFTQWSHLVCFVVSTVLAHNGEIHDYAGTECRSSIIAGHFVRNNLSEVVAYRYGDYTAQIVLESELHTKSQKLLKHTNSQVVSIMRATYRSQEETYVIQITDMGVSLYLYGLAKTIQIPWECSGNRLREHKGHVFTMSSMTGQLCMFDQAFDTWRAYWKPNITGSLLWEPGVMFVSFDLIDMDTAVFYYNTDRKTTTVVKVHRLNNGNEVLTDFFPSGICDTQGVGEDVTHCGGDLRVVGETLYVFTGEGRMNNVHDVDDVEAQNIASANGKVWKIRLDVSNYHPCMLASGLRHPWSVGFDNITQTFQIADVGDALFEEVNFVSRVALDSMRLNFGWPSFEAEMPVRAWRCTHTDTYSVLFFPSIIQSHDCPNKRTSVDLSWVALVSIAVATLLPICLTNITRLCCGKDCSLLPSVTIEFVGVLLASNVSMFLCYFPFVEYNTGPNGIYASVSVFGRHEVDNTAFGFLAKTYFKDIQFTHVTIYPLIFFIVHQTAVCLRCASKCLSCSESKKHCRLYKWYAHFVCFVAISIYIIYTQANEACGWYTPKNTLAIAFTLLVYSIYTMLTYRVVHTHPINNYL